MMKSCIVLLGPPGAGKGTQGKRLCEEKGWVHFSTGDLIRKEIAEGTAFGQSVVSYQREGRLVPDEMLLDVVSDFFSSVTVSGVVSDGFPRTVVQASSLDHILMDMSVKTQVIHLTTSLSVIMERALSRRLCTQCGAIYNLHLNPPKEESVCDTCSGLLSMRQDDTESVIAVRYGIYEAEIQNLLDYYGARVITIDGERHPDVVFRDLVLAGVTL